MRHGNFNLQKNREYILANSKRSLTISTEEFYPVTSQQLPQVREETGTAVQVNIICKFPFLSLEITKMN